MQDACGGKVLGSSLSGRIKVCVWPPPHSEGGVLPELTPLPSPAVLLPVCPPACCLGDIKILQRDLCVSENPLFLKHTVRSSLTEFSYFYLCMNSLLFERSTGNVPPREFAVIQTEKLLKSFRSALRFRFDGGERPARPAVRTRLNAVAAAGPSNSSLPAGPDAPSIWAHQAGVTALALERFDGRM